MSAEKIETYDSDLTALVHVLWSLQRDGLTLDDADEVAARIMQSKWMSATREHVATQERQRLVKKLEERTTQEREAKFNLAFKTSEWYISGIKESARYIAEEDPA